MTTIQKLKLRGFKSFANPIEIPFGNDFNVILGANGVGKSNLVDAMCFVLGKLSSKSLRAEKAANLIFNGGKKGSPMKEAQVDIFFDNLEKEFPLKEPVIKISRIVRKNGQSIYKINNQVRTRQQVIDLLSITKIDPEGHNIILQGDIVRFMEMKPLERRELIEEIAGISVYEDKKQKALNELEKVENKLNNANIILTERSANLRELKKERDQALRFKELEKRIKENKATYLHLQIKGKEEKRTELENKINKHKSLLKKITEKIANVKNEIIDRKQKIELINREIEEKGEKSQIEIREDVGNLRTIIIKDNARLETCQNEIKRIQERKKQLEKNLKDIDENIKNLEINKQNLEKRYKDLTTSEKKLTAGIKNFREEYKIEDLSKIAPAVNIDIDKLEKTILKLKEIISSIKQDQLKNILIDLDQKISILIKKISTLKTGIPKQSFSELQSLEQKRQSTHDQLIQIKTELKNIDTQIINIHLPEKENTVKILKEHEKEIQTFQAEINELNAKLKTQRVELQKREQKEKKFYSDYKNLFQRRNKVNEELQKKENFTLTEESKIREIENKINSISIIKAKIVAELEGLNKEFEEFSGTKIRKGIVLEVLKNEISRFERMKNEIGSVNLRALEIYEDIEREYKELLARVEKLKSEKEDVLKMMYEIDSKKKAAFMETLNVLSTNFKKIFSNLTTKGEAYLELEDKEEPFTAGLNIKVKLIGNKLLDIRSLSGGEKTLTALAFIFAIQEYKPASFYLLDEVDAALDKKNSEMLSKLINKYAQKAQYILISHNDAIITEANQIYGVSMQQNGVSKIVSLKI